VPLFHFIVNVTLVVPLGGGCGTTAVAGVAVLPPPEQPAAITASSAAPRTRETKDLGARFKGKAPIGEVSSTKEHEKLTNMRVTRLARRAVRP
jgi:hypothetical protein